MRTPILAEVSHTSIYELPYCDGLVMRGNKCYAIIGYVYPDTEAQEW
jgi:hypothetical protein